MLKMGAPSMKQRKANKSFAGKLPQSNRLVTADKLHQQGKMAEAETLYRQILRVAPANKLALYSLSAILLNSGRHEDALLNTTTGTSANPDFAPLWFVHASALLALHRRDEALACYDRALVLDPKYIDVLVNSGVLLRDMLRDHDALMRFHRVLEINPEHEIALGNYGILLTESNQGAQGVAIFERLIRKNSDYPYGLGLLCYERMRMCVWTDFETTTRQITAGIQEGRKVCKTLAYMAISDLASDHFLCAGIFAKNAYPRRPAPLWQGERYNHSRIRIAYVSPDFCEHPVGHLMAGVFEAHDKSRFETIAISIGVDDGSRIRARMIAAFDHFIDAKDMHPRKIAELMRQMEVDIAVDMAGYTLNAKIEIFLNRSAPIQVNYLGFPGTLGLDCYDYILADRTVITEDDQAYYTEKVAYLDHCYLPIASGIEVSEPKLRSAYGLPEHGFVFCAFSHDYKIHPKMFAVWMRLLESSPGSVLWLASRNDVSQKNLRQAAQDHGISPDRLVFATRVPMVEDHLARYRVADLFLDTWPYNAHTTAADALLVGLPVVTYKGNAFPARVAASLLETLGFKQLVTNSFDEYFELANGLAHDSGRLQSLKKSLSPAELCGHPFLGTSFTRSIENAFSNLVESDLNDVPFQQTGTPVVLPQKNLVPAKEQPENKAVGQCDTNLSKAPDNEITVKPDKSILEAAKLQECGKTAEAEAIYRTILKSNPADFVSSYSLGVIAFTRNDYFSALDYFEGAKKVNSGFAPLWYNTGITLGRLESYEEAVANLEQAIKLDPTYVAAIKQRDSMVDSLKLNSDVSAAVTASNNTEKIGKAGGVQGHMPTEMDAVSGSKQGHRSVREPRRLKVALEKSLNLIYDRIVEELATGFRNCGHECIVIDLAVVTTKAELLVLYNQCDWAIVTNGSGYLSLKWPHLHLFEEITSKVVFLHHDAPFNTRGLSDIQEKLDAFVRIKDRSVHFTIEKSDAEDFRMLGMIAHTISHINTLGPVKPGNEHVCLRDVAFIGHVVPPIWSPVLFGTEHDTDYYNSYLSRAAKLDHRIKDEYKELVTTDFQNKVPTTVEIALKMQYIQHAHLYSQPHRGAVLEKVCGHGVHIYGGDPSWLHGIEQYRFLSNANITYHKPVFEREQVINLFSTTRINVNITSLQFDTAVINRVMDCAASGGFILTDRKEQLYELTSVADEISCGTIEELNSKIDYFMKPEHQKQREEISRQMRLELEELCSVDKVVEYMVVVMTAG
jgi:predicted O-linked N-acetylglucosamine transferase (SPINDLY family)